MLSATQSHENKAGFVLWVLAGGIAVLIWCAIAMPHLLRHRTGPVLSGPAMQETTDSYQGGLSQTRAPRKESMSLMSASLQPPAAPRPQEDRKMIRTSSVDLIVQKPAETADKIRALAEGMGGFLVSSEMSGKENSASGSMTIRVPATRFNEARAAIRKLGLHVESEKVEAQDVTRQYVDREANLRNLRAEEAQFLAILKRASTVKDTLEVSEKLSDVRGQIEQEQAEFDTLSKQIETVAITISLRAEAEAQVFGLNWRPLYQLKLALRDGLDAVGEYGSSMASLLFYLPAVLLWTATIIVGAAVSWKLLRWAGRTFFAWPKAQAHVVQNG